jgi:hypothetical protein
MRLRIPLCSPTGPLPTARRLAFLRWSHDGSSLALALAEKPGQVMLVHAGVLQRVFDTIELGEGGRELVAGTGAAFSPNGTCLAVTCATIKADAMGTSSGGCRLKVCWPSHLLHLH